MYETKRSCCPIQKIICKAQVQGYFVSADISGQGSTFAALQCDESHKLHESGRIGDHHHGGCHLHRHEE